MFPYIIASILLIILAVLIGKFHLYNLISGYNTMTKEEKSKYDIEGFGRLLYKTYLMMGVLVFIDGLFVYIMGNTIINIIALILIIILGVVFLILNAKKFKNKNVTYPISNKPSKKIIYIILFISFLSVAYIFYFGLKVPSYSINKKEFEINGLYGFKLAYSDILSIDTINALPNISFKENGFAVNHVYKGYFKTDEGITVKLIVLSNVSPYIKIETKTDENFYINFDDRQKTLYLFQQLQNTINNKQSY